MTTLAPPKPALAGAAPRTIATTGLVAGVLIIASPMIDSAPGTIGWIAGFVALLPFFAGFGAIVGPDERWLAPLMAAAAGAAAGLQLTVLAVAHVAGTLALDSPVHEPLHAIESTLFALSLLPLGAALAAAAIAIVVRRRLPVWLGYLTGLVALVLFANGANLGTEDMPGLMAFILWLFIAGLTVMIRPPKVITHDA